MAVGLGAGCSSSAWPTADVSHAGTHVEPVGPIALLEEAPRETTSDPGATAVHLAGGPAERTAVVPDSKIRLDVGMKLEEASLDLSRMEVEVDEQCVELTGTISTLRERDRAELIARSVRGVDEVDNELSVRGVEGSAARQ